MNVRIAAFQLTYHSKLTLDTLANELQKKQGQRIMWPPHQRILHVARDGDFVLGALLTDRGHRAFVAIDTASNALSKGQLDKGKNFAAFSFFILCKRKPAAIITSYRDAGGESFIFGVLEKFGSSVLTELRDKQITLEGAGITPRRKKSIESIYEGPSLEWTEYLGQAEYAAVLRRWKRIKAIELAYKADKAPAAYLPFDGDDLQTSQLRLTFKRKTLVTRVVDYVKQLRNHKTRNENDEFEGVLRVEGIDDLGLARRVEIREKIPSLLGDLDHDQVIAEPTTFHPDLKNSYVIKHLKYLIASNTAIFG
jgi:hypothetical protein